MNLVRLIVISGIALLFTACGSENESFNRANSQSFAEKQITLEGALSLRIGVDSVNRTQESSFLIKNLEEMLSVTATLKKTKSDSSWTALQKNWEEFRSNEAVLLADTSGNSVVVLQKWAELNSQLLKLTSEVRFGDALEKLIYEPKFYLPERLIKSVIYTHIDDQIFINLFGSSSLNHQHTTGGAIKLIQKTEYPSTNEIALFCECSDTRYLDVFIRIPEWAVNPTVTHGNVKYVARPGEYCQISRKWRNGDEFSIELKN
ncbi:MAG: glycoside hydrolase family 127 protein [Prolixibacteraceae bacterium]|nr:glycoside hydrolase family 127 protein [Prolixibacteraceae bacterium]